MPLLFTLFGAIPGLNTRLVFSTLFVSPAEGFNRPAYSPHCPAETVIEALALVQAEDQSGERVDLVDEARRIFDQQREGSR